MILLAESIVGMEPDESMHSKLCRRAAPKGGSIRVGGFFFRMSDADVCSYCNYPHADRPKGRRLMLSVANLVTLKVGVLRTPICRFCHGLAVETRAEPIARVRSIFSRLDVEEAEHVCQEQDWAGGERILSLTSKADLHLEKLKNEGYDLMKAVSRIQAEYDEVLRWKQGIEIKIGEAFRASYEARRKEANAIISKRFVRAIVFSRDGFKCVQCSSPERLTVDHIIPVYHHGSNELSNLQTLCHRCNTTKGAKFRLAEFDAGAENFAARRP